jgi:hypothetical protein
MRFSLLYACAVAAILTGQDAAAQNAPSGFLSETAYTREASSKDNGSSTVSSVLHSESSFAIRDHNYYSTLVTALNRDLDKDGVLLAIEGTLNKFYYNSFLDYAGTRISGTEWQGAAFMGYQLIRNEATYTGYAGIDYQSIRLSPFDLDNPLRGQRAGLKLMGEIETEKEKNYYFDINAEYSTAFHTYFARARVGDKYGAGPAASKVAIGPEGAILGDQTAGAQRLGLFIRLPIELEKIGSFDLIAASGYQWVTSTGSAQTANPAGGKGNYATISFAIAF